MKSYFCLAVLAGLASAAIAAPVTLPASPVRTEKTRCHFANHKYIVVGRVALKVQKDNTSSSDCLPAANLGKEAAPARTQP